MSVKTKIIILSVVFGLAVGVSGYGIVTGNDTINEELPRMLILALTFAGAIVKILWGNNRVHKSQDFYEMTYKKQLENAFSDDPKKRKKLLTAVRLFDEDKYKKSVKMLTKLKGECTCGWDRCAVGLFLARNYTEMGEIAKAHAVYKELIDHLEVTETIYNNMGYLSQIYYQDMEEALMYYKKALDINPKHANTYNNIANIYFNMGYWDDAEMFAKKHWILTLRFIRRHRFWLLYIPAWAMMRKQASILRWLCPTEKTRLNSKTLSNIIRITCNV